MNQQPPRHLRTGTTRRRAGIIILWFLFTISLFVVIGLLAVNSWRMLLGQMQQHRNTDADALAATAVLADDRLLFGNETDIYNGMSSSLVLDSRAEAIKYAGYNYVDGAAFSVLDEDVTFGTGTLYPTRSFTPIADLSMATVAELRAINAVRVEGIRNATRKNMMQLFGCAAVTMYTRSTAIFDRSVVGFKAYELRNAPLAPLAIFSDPTAANSISWEFQVEAPATPPPAMGAIPYGTMTVNIGYPGFTDTAIVNAQTLKIGTATFADFLTQFENGVTLADFAAFTTETGTTNFELDDTTGELIVPDHTAPTQMTTDFTDLLDLLQNKVAGKCMVWPLYDSVDPMTGDVTVTQFVAAKVSGATTATSMGQMYITFTLTPCMMQTPTARTDPARTVPMGARPLENRYVGRIRLLD